MDIKSDEVVNTTVQAIQEYIKTVYGEDVVITDSNRIGVAYTTTQDGKHDIEVYVNPSKYRVEKYLDCELATRDDYESFEALMDCLYDYDDLIYIPEEIISMVTETGLYNPNIKPIEFYADGQHCVAYIYASTYILGGNPYFNLVNVKSDPDTGQEFLEPYKSITVNITDHVCEGYRSLVDINNFPEAVDIIREYNLGIPTCEVAYSDFCEYPEYRFDISEVAKYCINPQELKDEQSVIPIARTRKDWMEQNDKH